MGDTADRGKIVEVTSAFGVQGDVTGFERNTTGHIHQTYIADVGDLKYTVQRINPTVFADIPALMGNIGRVTEHIRSKLEAVPNSYTGREVLRYLPASDGKYFYMDDAGHAWRCYRYIEKARTYDLLDSDDKAYQAANAFGRFQRLLADLPGGPLAETIPFFHHTPKRLETLEAAVKADTEGRVAQCADEIEFAMQQKAMASALVDGVAAGDLPLRVTHNDCKVNNVLIDDATGKGICVIDLDTVMPGTVLFDFGDMIRTFTPTGAEDEADLSRYNMSLSIFEALTKGYIDAAGDMLCDAELDGLVTAGKVITYTIGIRFLADYLSGDTYFQTSRDGHNLDRTRTQFKLVNMIEENEQAMRNIVASART